LERNILIVTNNADDPALFQSHCTVDAIHWITPSAIAPSMPFECDVQIRYRQAPQKACIEQHENGFLTILFHEPQRAVTPGQSAVLYDGDTVLGGGIIAEVG
jgi:tRNA-uridine 2-sulfurtransferase